MPYTAEDLRHTETTAPKPAIWARLQVLHDLGHSLPMVSSGASTLVPASSIAPA